MVKKLFSYIKDFTSGLGRIQIQTYSAASAYYLFVSLVPLLMLLTALLRYTPITDEFLMSFIVEYFPEPMAEIISGIINSIYVGSGIALVVSIVLALFLFSAVFKSILRGLDAVYEADRKDTNLMFSLRAALYFILLLFSAVLLLVFIVYWGRITAIVTPYLPQELLESKAVKLLGKLKLPFTFFFLFCAFTFFYKWAPASRGRYVHQFAGAFVSAAGWTVLSLIFSVYLLISPSWGAYGFFGTVIISLLWLFNCLKVFFFGGYINNFLMKRRILKLEEEEDV